MTLLQIFLATLIVSLISLVGIMFSLREQWLNKALSSLVAIAAGALMGAAFLHLIPEAIEKKGNLPNIFIYLLIGFLFFFILEQLLHWHHQHGTGHKVEPFSYLILVGDSVHNFFDGLAIAASFMISFPAGLITTLAVALHEIPQEFGDFAVLIYGGFSRKQALIFNFLSGITAVAGGVIGYFAFSLMQASIPYLMLFVSGGFIYIAAADLIPSIKHGAGLRQTIITLVAFLAGIVLMLVMKE
ncbi:MAG: ZIP family metal transporter [Dehalococcoidales bacterium]|nr:ZIP family metal transporter [Dehalococcoidales bacterium]